VPDEAKDLVACAVAADAGADLLDHAGEVATERDRELVLGHAPQHPAGDRPVDRVDRGRSQAHANLVVAEVRCRQIVPQAG
jgi:hypothetical protein